MISEACAEQPKQQRCVQKSEELEEMGKQQRVVQGQQGQGSRLSTVHQWRGLKTCRAHTMCDEI